MCFFFVSPLCAPKNNAKLSGGEDNEFSAGGGFVFFSPPLPSLPVEDCCCLLQLDPFHFLDELYVPCVGTNSFKVDRGEVSTSYAVLHLCRNTSKRYCIRYVLKVARVCFGAVPFYRLLSPN